MSGDRWKWSTQCEGMPCIGDCDFCDFEPLVCEDCKHYETCKDKTDICDKFTYTVMI